MTCLSIDVFICAAAFLAWAFYDMHVLQMSLATFIALCAGLAVALAMPIPLYLAARTVRQIQVEQEALQVSEPHATIMRCSFNRSSLVHRKFAA